MTNYFDIRTSLEQLQISQTEVAVLLDVNPRTVRRWIDGSQKTSGAAEQAIRAWLRLNNEGLAWRPDSISLVASDREAIAAQCDSAIELNGLLDRVENRGVPNPPWVVDLEKSEARLGTLRVTFYKLKNGGFSPQFYTRTDKSPDKHRDAILIEDAFYCVAMAFKKEASLKVP